MTYDRVLLRGPRKHRRRRFCGVMHRAPVEAGLSRISSKYRRFTRFYLGEGECSSPLFRVILRQLHAREQSCTRSTLLSAGALFPCLTRNIGVLPVPIWGKGSAPRATPIRSVLDLALHFFEDGITRRSAKLSQAAKPPLESRGALFECRATDIVRERRIPRPTRGSQPVVPAARNKRVRHDKRE